MSNQLVEELITQAICPPAGDERIGAFSQSMLDLSKTSLGSSLIDAVEARRFETSSYGANLLLRALQKQLMREEADYPLEFDDPDRWSSAIGRLLISDANRAELEDDLAFNHTQSNVVERYKSIKLSIELLAPLIPSAPSLADVGCSRNHGLKKLHLCLPFGKIVSGVSTTDGAVSSVVTDRLLNSLINSPKSYSQSSGFDTAPIDSESNGIWAKSCSFYPSELLDDRGVKEYDHLEAAEPISVNFNQRNIISDTAETKENYDVVIASTILYQLTPAQRMLASLGLRQMVSEEGIIIYQDFARLGRGGQEIRYEDSWFARLYPYRTLVELPAHTGTKLHEIFRWSNGRCTSWVPGKDLHALISDVAVA